MNGPRFQTAVVVTALCVLLADAFAGAAAEVAPLTQTRATTRPADDRPR